MDMENKDINVPYIVYESAMARAERQIKRLTIALILLMLLIVATNGAWLYVWSSYEFMDGYSEVQVDSDGGNANYIGNDGEINNGENNSKESE